MEWLGFALVFIGIVTPLLVFPFVEADKGQNIITHGYLELLKEHPVTDQKTISSASSVSSGNTMQKSQGSQ